MRVLPHSMNPFTLPEPPLYCTVSVQWALGWQDSPERWLPVSSTLLSAPRPLSSLSPQLSLPPPSKEPWLQPMTGTSMAGWPPSCRILSECPLRSAPPQAPALVPELADRTTLTEPAYGLRAPGTLVLRKTRNSSKSPPKARRSRLKQKPIDRLVGVSSTMPVPSESSSSKQPSDRGSSTLSSFSSQSLSAPTVVVSSVVSLLPSSSVESTAPLSSRSLPTTA